MQKKIKLQNPPYFISAKVIKYVISNSFIHQVTNQLKIYPTINDSSQFGEGNFLIPGVSNHNTLPYVVKIPNLLPVTYPAAAGIKRVFIDNESDGKESEVRHSSYISLCKLFIHQPYTERNKLVNMTNLCW